MTKAEGAQPKSEPLYLIDGSGFIFRAFHALPPLTRDDGTPVNAVFGFSNMMLKLLAEKHARRIAIVFDAKRKNFRNDIYSEYKAHRPPPPPELVPQFPIIREAATAFNLPCIEMEGFEADDLIATYTKLAHEAGVEVFIVSSDKDMMQLIKPGVRMIDPIRYNSIGPEEVKEKFGVEPEKLVEVQALMGDTSDNVPGVPGIGVKTAAQLIQEYGSVEDLLKRVDEIQQPKRRQLLADNAESIKISKKLVTLKDDVPITIPLEALAIHAIDEPRLFAFLKKQGFKSILSRLEKKQTAEGAPHEEVEAEEAKLSKKVARKYELIQDTKQLEKWIAEAYERGRVAISVEADHPDNPTGAKLVGISLAIAPGEACYIPLQHISSSYSENERSLELDKADVPPQQIPVKEALALIKPLFEDEGVLKIGYNVKNALQILLQGGIKLWPYDDVMLLAYSLYAGLHSFSLDELVERYLGEKITPYKEVTKVGKAYVTFDRLPLDKAMQYSAEAADANFRLYTIFKPQLVPSRVTVVYETIERPLIPVIADMEMAGVKIDKDALAGISKELSKRIGEIEEDIYKLAGHEFNVGSPKQLGEVLFQEMGLLGAAKGKTGAYSTNIDVLEDLAEQGHEIAVRVIDWRQLSKLRSTYTDTLPEKINKKTGRVHTSFSMAATTTGRLASTDPNLQNIPIRTQEGRRIRTAFVAEEGYKLISVDYSQVELRLIAHIADVPMLKEAFQKGQDIHAITASQVFGVALKDVTAEMRRGAKAVNFGIIYGIGGFGLARQLGITTSEASTFIKRYLDRYPEIVAYMDSAKEFCRTHGYVKTMFGRRCHIPGIKDRNASKRAAFERQAINAPLQGTGADIIKMAMIKLPEVLKKEGLKARVVLQVHDELLLEAPEKEAADTAKIAKQVMEGVVSLSVPLSTEASIGNNWGEMK